MSQHHLPVTVVKLYINSRESFIGRVQPNASMKVRFESLPLDPACRKGFQVEALEAPFWEDIWQNCNIYRPCQWFEPFWPSL